MRGLLALRCSLDLKEKEKEQGGELLALLRGAPHSEVRPLQGYLAYTGVLRL